MSPRKKKDRPDQSPAKKGVKQSPAATITAPSYLRMISNHEGPGARWYGVVDEQGYIVCLTGTPIVPTFEDLVRGWMAIPITHCKQGVRDATGCPIHHEEWLTREQAIERVRRSHPYLEPKP